MTAAPTNGTSKLSQWSSIVMVGVAVLSGLFALFSSINTGKANSDALVAQIQLNATMAAQIQVLQLKQSNMEVAMNEIETQFCSQDIVRNLMHAADLRTTSLLWEKVYGMKIPTDNAYYPTICNRQVRR